MPTSYTRRGPVFVGLPSRSSLFPEVVLLVVSSGLGVRADAGYSKNGAASTRLSPPPNRIPPSGNRERTKHREHDHG